MVYKHVIGLKTDASQSNLGGNTDSNHLIPGVVGHFPSVSLSRRPIQLVILISFFFSPASDAGVLPPLWRGRVFPFTVQSRDHLATITDIYVPSFPYVHSPAFNAGFYFVHCAMENCLDLAIRTGGAAGSDAPTQTLIRLFRADRLTADTLVYILHTRVGVYSFRKRVSPRHPVTPDLLYSSNFGAKIGIKKRVSNFGTRLGMTVLFRY